MIAHFVEAGNDFNHGKFLLLRYGPEERRAMSALPGYEDESLWTIGGRRKFRPDQTMVVDLQTGEGAAFTLYGTADNATYDLEKHRIWVCPMFEPFLRWLYDQPGLAEGAGDITALPRYVQLDAPGAFAGHRREGGLCRICGIEEERHGLCAGHREEWIQWAASRPAEQNDEGFDRWIESRIRARDVDWTPRELSVLNALVTYAAENIPGGLAEDERAIALKVGRGALTGAW